MTTRRQGRGIHRREEQLLDGAAAAVDEDGVARPTNTSEVLSRRERGQRARGAEEREVHGRPALRLARRAGAGAGRPTTASATPSTLTSWATRSGPSISGSVRSASVKKRPTRVEPDVGEEQRARRPLEASRSTRTRSDEHDEVPERLVEERRVEELVLGVHAGAGAAGEMKSFHGSSVGVPKASSLKKLPQRPMACPRARLGAAMSRYVAHGQPPPPRVAAAHEDAADHAAVDGEPALPHREDLPGELEVVVEVEQHVVEAGADEAAEQRRARRP